MESLISILVTVLVVALIAGVVYYLIGLAPFIPPELKAPLQWVVLAIVVIWLLLYFVRHVHDDDLVAQYDEAGVSVLVG